jgi:hypothetical protein
MSQKTQVSIRLGWLIGLVTFLLILPHLHGYSAVNAGVFIDGFGHTVGFEYRGTPGFFIDVD